MKAASFFVLGTLIFAQAAMAERLVCRTVVKSMAPRQVQTYVFSGNNVLLQNSNSFRVASQPKTSLRLGDPKGRFNSASSYLLQGRAFVDTAYVTEKPPFTCSALMAVSVPGCENLLDYLNGVGDRAKTAMITYSVSSLSKPSADFNAALKINFVGKSATTATIYLKCQVIR